MARQKKVFTIPELPDSEKRTDLDDLPDEDNYRSASPAMQGARIRTLESTISRLEKDALHSVAPDTIRPTRFKNRNEIFLKSKKFQELVDQIRIDGQLVPICVRPSESDEHQYDLVYGRRRLEACKKLGINVITIISNASDKELLIKQFLENVRSDLNHFEESANVQLMMNESFFKSSTEIAEALGVSKGKISQLLSLRKIPKWMLEEYLTESIEKDGYLEVEVAPLIAVRNKFSKHFEYISQAQLEQLKETLESHKDDYFGLSGTGKWNKRIDYIISLVTRNDKKLPKNKPSNQTENFFKIGNKNFGKIVSSPDKGISVQINKAWYSKSLSEEIEQAVKEIIERKNSSSEEK